MEQPQKQDEIWKQANQLLEEFNREVIALDKWNPPIDTLASGREILTARDDVQRAVLLLAIDYKFDALVQGAYLAGSSRTDLIHLLMKQKIGYSQDEIARVVQYALNDRMHSFPFGLLLRRVEEVVGDDSLVDPLQEAISSWLNYVAERAHGTHSKKTIKRLETLGGVRERQIALLDQDDPWAKSMGDNIDGMKSEDREVWINLLELAGDIKSTRPSKKWLAEAEEVRTAIGIDVFATHLLQWLDRVHEKGTRETRESHPWDADANELISPHNVPVLKGLVWMTCGIENAELIRKVADVGEYCIKKVKGYGPRCPVVANACIHSLARSGNALAIAELGRLKTRIKHASIRKQLEKAMLEASEAAGMSVHDLEELSTPTFGFTERGKRKVEFDDCQAEVSIDGDKVNIAWTTGAGKHQKSVPASVKRDFADQLKQLKKSAKDLEKLLPSFRHRIENSLINQRHWTYATWKERYQDHPIVSTLACRLIWRFGATAGIVLNDRIVDVDGKQIDVESNTNVELWHPIGATPDEVLRWRTFLVEHEMTQPFKQAHREIYVITDAERETGTYSNRFAAHIIRQFQFAELCKQRQWNYSLQGQFDSYNTPTRKLVPWNLDVSFIVEPAGDEHSDTFIYLYLGTDQVRFVRPSGEAVPLSEVMPIVFSECMRDVDLFVGVCSVGNDPEWADRGEEDPHFDYWSSFSFGDLSQTAKTRKTVLEEIIPRLAIGKVCSFSEKFLIVEGKLRTYKIHLGSGNVLMEPNDEYLCIVRAPSSSTGKADRIYLPFQGDNLLSVILSKALMLAEDDKIKDSSIMSQIRRGL